jgi:uncharacterized membrane protein
MMEEEMNMPIITEEEMNMPIIKENEMNMAISKAEKCFAPVCIILGLFLVESLFFHMTTLLMTISVMLTLSAGVLYLKVRGFSMTKPHRILFAVLMVFALAYSYTANRFLCVLVTLFEAGGCCTLCYLITGTQPLPDFCLPALLQQAMVQFPFKNQSVLPRAIREGLHDAQKTKNLAYMVLGLLITIPLTLIVASLLMSADDGVARILNSFLARLLPDLWRVGWRLVLAVILACFLLGMLYTCATGRSIVRVNAEHVDERLSRLRIAPGVLLCAGVLPICLLYCIFVYSQAGYLLAAFAHRLPEGFSYAQYARQGFFELCALALINLSVIIALKLLAKNEERDQLPLRLFSLILDGFTLFILATAFRKMLLYIERFGLTALRFYTSWFMVLLTVIFLLLIIREFRRTLPVFQCSLITFVVWFFLLVFSRPDALIASYNYEMYQSGQLSQMDYQMICDLSADAWSVLGSKEEIPSTYRLAAATDLKRQGDTSLNLSTFLAKRALHSGKDLNDYE